MPSSPWACGVHALQRLPSPFGPVISTLSARLKWKTRFSQVFLKNGWRRSFIPSKLGIKCGPRAPGGACRALQRKYGSISLSPFPAHQITPNQGETAVQQSVAAGSSVSTGVRDEGSTSEAGTGASTPRHAAWPGSSAAPAAADEEEDSTMDLRSQLIRTR